MKTLIVEDEFISRNIILAFLAERGTCDVAAHGGEAVEAFERAYVRGAPYDLVCLDLSMPVMDGHETLRRMRALESRKAVAGLDRVRIVITTSHWDSKNMFPAFRAECDGYLAKPITKQALDELVCSLGLPVRS